ncbi:MAG TPA: hypothetical protein VHZ49_05735 [Methylomirabilota bacterium]|jgi:hypothetical protein|nr:hypothetical protein [Methylomirabilota bacterium]
MTLSFLVATCAFVAVLGVVVAWIDRWRESRLGALRPVARVSVPVATVASAPAARKRAA